MLKWEKIITFYNKYYLIKKYFCTRLEVSSRRSCTVVWFVQSSLHSTQSKQMSQTHFKFSSFLLALHTHSTFSDTTAVIKRVGFV